MIAELVIVISGLFFIVCYLKALDNPTGSFKEQPPTIVEKGIDNSHYSRRHQQSLKRKEKKLEEQDLLLTHKGRIQEVKETFLNVRERELALIQEQNMLAIKKGIQDLYFRIENFKIARKEWNLKKAKDCLELYHREILLIEKTAQSMFQIREEQLKLLDRELRVDHKERSLEYKGIMQYALNQIKELNLKRVEISQHATNLELGYIERELARKVSVIQAIEENWYLNNDVPSIKAYNQSGYYMESPLIHENIKLRESIDELKRRLPEGK